MIAVVAYLVTLLSIPPILERVIPGATNTPTDDVLPENVIPINRLRKVA